MKKTIEFLLNEYNEKIESDDYVRFCELSEFAKKGCDDLSEKIECCRLLNQIVDDQRDLDESVLLCLANLFDIYGFFFSDFVKKVSELSEFCELTYIGDLADIWFEAHYLPISLSCVCNCSRPVGVSEEAWRYNPYD